MEKYVVNITYTLVGYDYTEVNGTMPCVNKVYDTIEDAIRDLKNDIKRRYDNEDYRGLQVNFPQINSIYHWSGWFKCAYIFGPKIRYDCRIKQITI